MNVLSIQSQVACGHVGNSAAVFALERLGLTAWAVPTVILSHHPGHAAAPERLSAPSPVAPLLDGLARRGVLPRCDGIISGYAVSADQIGEIAAAVDRTKAANGTAIYVCDPVLGNDTKGFFVDSDLAATYRADLVPRADIVLPNRFELSALTGNTPRTLEEVADCAKTLIAHGPQWVIVKGLRDGDRIGALAVGRDAGWIVWTPFVEDAADDGAGDLFGALFIGHYLTDADVARALSRATSSVHAIVAATAAASADDLRLIEEQESLLDPRPAFSAAPWKPR